MVYSAFCFAIVVSPFGGVSIEPPVANVSFKGNATFECSSGGGPDNEFQWINLQTGDIVHIGPQLNIDSVIFTDGGEYECQVSNIAGFGSAVAALNSMYAQSMYTSWTSFLCFCSSCFDIEKTR